MIRIVDGGGGVLPGDPNHGLLVSNVWSKSEMSGQMAKWPDIMSGEKFCVILRSAIYFLKTYIKRNLDGGTSTPEKLCWGISCASLFLPLFRGLNHACENEGLCTISTRIHTGFPVSQILMRKGHKSQGLGHHWKGGLTYCENFKAIRHPSHPTVI